MTAVIERPLFATCPLPGCRNLVSDATRPCSDCFDAFGTEFLRPVDTGKTEEQVVADLEERDRAIREHLAMQRAIAKAAERREKRQCGICEQERVCLEVSPGWWECRSCRSSQ